MVTFAAENAKEWYGTMVAEDPNDPTGAISDDEVIETLLVGGTWCPTGKLYLCKWDTEHTILAVGVAADENPGVLLRQSIPSPRRARLLFPNSWHLNPRACVPGQ